MASKIHFVSFRVTPEELFLLTAAAAAVGQRPSSFARDLALAALDDGALRHGAGPGAHARLPNVRKIVQVPAGNMELYAELRRQGVNLNQIAHHCHRMQVAPPATLDAVLDELGEVMRRLVPDGAR